MPLLIVLGVEKTCDLKKCDNVALISCKNCRYFVENITEKCSFYNYYRNSESKKGM